MKSRMLHSVVALRVYSLDAVAPLIVSLYVVQKRKSLLSISSSLTPKNFSCDTRIYEIWPIDYSVHMARHP